MPEITYIKCGDYLLPNIILKDDLLENVEPLTKYGIMRRTYLKNHRSVLFNRLLLTEELFPHLRNVQKQAEIRLVNLMAQLLEQNPPPEKNIDNFAWAAHMSMLKAIAEESIFEELIYQ